GMIRFQSTSSPAPAWMCFPFPAVFIPRGYGKLWILSGRMTRTVQAPRSRRLFGYGTELATVVDALCDAERAGALIIGPAGVGKTTVLNAALSRLVPNLCITRLRGSNHARTQTRKLRDPPVPAGDRHRSRSRAIAVGDRRTRRTEVRGSRFPRRRRQCRPRRRPFPGRPRTAGGRTSGPSAHRRRIGAP